MLRFGGSWVFRLQLERQRTGGQVSGAENVPERKSSADSYRKHKTAFTCCIGCLEVIATAKKNRFSSSF